MYRKDTKTIEETSIPKAEMATSSSTDETKKKMSIEHWLQLNKFWINNKKIIEKKLPSNKP